MHKSPGVLVFHLGYLGEFALITALNFGKDSDIVKLKSMSGSMRLKETNLNNEATIYHDPHYSLNSTRVKEEGVQGDKEDENKKETAEAKRATEEAGIFNALTDEVEEQPSENLPRSYTFYTELKSDITELKVHQADLENAPEQQQTSGMKEVHPSEIAGVQFHMKKWVAHKTKRLIDYTDLSNKKFK
ncbi:hypothetical protein TorRG33x02_157790, partial [Trema orientale]